jgi:RNA polymerase sigma-70 factor (ECF subfamily)
VDDSPVAGQGSTNDRRELTSLSLLDRLRQDDAASWEQLIGLYGSLVYSWCRQWGLQSTDAADVVQEVFRSVAAHLGQFRRDRPGDSFRKWLKAITTNQLRDHFRRLRERPQAIGGSQAHQRMQEQPQETTLDHLATDSAEIRHVLRQALELVRADYEPQTWQAFWQTAVEGRDTRDVAAELGITANAVRIAKSRVRSRLRQEFGDLLDEASAS